MKKIMISMHVLMLSCAFVHASLLDSAVQALNNAAQAVQSQVSNAASNVVQVAQNNPHIFAGVALFLSRPVLGILTQAEQYSLERLAGLKLTSDQNSAQATLNIGGLALQATTLSNDQVQQNGLVSVSAALKEVADPASSGSAQAVAAASAAKKSIKVTKKAGTKSEVSPAVVQDLQDLAKGNTVWAVNLQANIGNMGVQGTVGLSDVVLSVLGGLAVLALQMATVANDVEAVASTVAAPVQP